MLGVAFDPEETRTAQRHKTLKRHLRKLDDLGLIERRERYVANRQRGNEFVLCVDREPPTSNRLGRPFEREYRQGVP